MHDFYLNRFLQKLFFGNSGQAKVLVTLLAFLLNLALVMGIDFGFIHNIPLPETQFQPPNSHFTYPDFRPAFDGEILDMDGEKGGGYHVLYRDPSGETHVVELAGSGAFFRYQLKNGSRITLPQGQDPFVYDEGNTIDYLRFTVTDDRFEDFSERDFQLFSGNIHSRLMGAYMLIALGLLIAEGFILSKIRPDS